MNIVFSDAVFVGNENGYDYQDIIVFKVHKMGQAFQGTSYRYYTEFHR